MNLQVEWNALKAQIEALDKAYDAGLLITGYEAKRDALSAKQDEIAGDALRCGLAVWR